MKNVLHLLLFVISFSVVAVSQTITFDKTFSKATAEQVFPTEDGGYLLNRHAVYPPGLPAYIKTDQHGYIEWIKEYRPSFYNIYKTNDGNYFAVGTIYNGLYPDISLVKLDNQLDTIWIQTYGIVDQTEYGQSAIQLPDGSFLISSFDLEGSGFYIRKTDLVGNLLWSKKVSAPSLTQSYLINLDNDNFLFGKSSQIIKMNSEADTLWTKSLNGVNRSFITNDGHILVSTQFYLKKYDLDGNEIWQIENGGIESFSQTSNGNYVLLKGRFDMAVPSTILITDTDGNIISQIPFENNGESISSTDDGFVICGGISPIDHFEYTWLLKTDSNLNYTAINLRQPLDSANLNTFTTYPIVWRSKNVNYVNIDYSTDNQNTWTNIINYYPAEADTFYWTVPQLPDGEIFIRISDSFNPDVYDRSDPPQTAINYQSTDYIAANEIKMWMGNNGMNSHDPRTDGSGFYWPGGEDATIPAIFADGLVWGGKVNSEIRANGSTYRYGLTPGYILPSGLPSDPLDVKSKIFKLKKDWQYLPPSPERDRYEFDYVNWPVDVGAAWDDNDGDGVYTPGIDNPKIFGDETLFFVANDLDTATTLYTYGSNPIGLEFQVTTFGYNCELLKDAVFKKYKIINKSPDTVTDMYLTYWTDDDLGNYNDDYVGCDTLLNLGYTYNADNSDEGYYGTPPPAVGHLMIQPPIISAEPTDSARFGDGWKTGFNNIPINSYFVPFIDPPTGYPAGTIYFYNYMQGLLWDGSPIIDPITNLQTHYFVPGDPVAGTGWYEGDGWPGGPLPGDRRFILTSGPLNMAPNDTQEVVIAILIKQGTDNINSIAVLKDYAAQIQHWYDNNFVTDVEETISSIPTEFSLSQNYPNPFNPITTIKYTIPNVTLSSDKNGINSVEGSRVILKVYDILGSEVTTLVNEEKPAGNYQVNFNAVKLSSGVYFYRLQAGSFVETKKMVILK